MSLNDFANKISESYIAPNVAKITNISIIQEKMLEKVEEMVWQIILARWT
jgi:hypothetical protein